MHARSPDPGSDRNVPSIRGIRPLQDFLHAETTSSVLIVGAIVGALLWANSPWSDSYDELWSTILSISLDGHALDLDLRHWVSDAAMTVFFLVVGLEIKREFVVGELRDRRKAAVPMIAALGGMAVPALVYLVLAPDQPRGWAVPTATDIALALGALSVLAHRVPASLRSFLLTLAIVDDIAAVLVIALFYSDGLRLGPLLLAAAATAVAYTFRQRLGGGGIAVFCVVLWLLLHEAGVHATLAGVVAGLIAPLTPVRRADLVDLDELVDIATVESAGHTMALARQSVSTVEWLEHRLHTWSTTLIVPLFALANAGIPLNPTALSDAASSAVSWAIVGGLVVGKPLGIFVLALLATRLLRAELPAGADRRDLLGIGALSGIGFTVSLVIAGRAFADNPALYQTATLAILGGSVLAAAVGFSLLFRRRSADPADRQLGDGV